MFIYEKLILGLALLALVVFGLSACKTAELTKYEHEQSSDFYKNFDFNASNISDFKAGEVLLVIDINKVTHKSYVVWLGLYSDKAGKTIKIDNVVATGDGWERKQFFNREYVLDTLVPDNKLFEFDKGLKLFELDENDLRSVVNASGEFFITVFYDVGNGAESKIFILKKIVEKQIVFPT